MLRVEVEREDDGRWIAEVPDVPGVLVYGATKAEARLRAKALADEVIREANAEPGSTPARDRQVKEP